MPRRGGRGQPIGLHVLWCVDQARSFSTGNFNWNAAEFPFFFVQLVWFWEVVFYRQDKEDLSERGTKKLSLPAQHSLLTSFLNICIICRCTFVFSRENVSALSVVSCRFHGWDRDWSDADAGQDRGSSLCRVGRSERHTAHAGPLCADGKGYFFHFIYFYGKW